MIIHLTSIFINIKHQILFNNWNRYTQILGFRCSANGQKDVGKTNIRLGSVLYVQFL